MVNTFISVKEIARQLLPRLIENLVFPNLIHKDFSDQFVNGKGATIQVKKPVILEAVEFNEANGVTAQDMKEESVEVTLDKLATVDVQYGAIQAVTNVDDLNRLFIEPAAVALAEKINSDGLALAFDIKSTVGTAGTTPSGLTSLAAVRKQLNIQKVPVAGRVAVWDPEADAAFTTVDAIVNAEKSGSTAALREGSIGKIFGLDNYMAQGVKTITGGALTAGGTGATGVKVKTAIAEGSESKTVVLVSNASASATLTGTVKKGDIATIDGKDYLVTEDCTAASNEVSLKIDTAIAVAINTAVTLKGNHTANIAFNPAAFAFVTRPLAVPSGVESYVTSYNGITLRVVKGYDMQYKREMLSMDVLYGYKTMYPELAVRVLG